MVMIEGQTEEDWWRYAPESRICEYIDGIIYMPSPATAEHLDDVGFLFFLLNGFRYSQGGGTVRTGPGVLQLAPGRNPEPDIFVLPPEGEPGPPALLVVETLSKSTRSHDLKRKAAIFQDAGIPEVLYVDLAKKRLGFLHKVAGEYRTDWLEDGLWISEAVPGFWFDVTWLWEDPLPNPLTCLEIILAGPPA
jgi:Uma2 family endonuclease